MLEMQGVPTLLRVYQWLQSSVVRKMKEVYQDRKGTGRLSNFARLCLQWSSKWHKAYTECCKRTWSFPGCGAIWMRVFSAEELEHAMAPHWYCSTEALIRHRTLVNGKYFSRARSIRNRWLLNKVFRGAGETKIGFHLLPRRRDADKHSKILVRIFKYYLHGVKGNQE